jgi:uncharacterized membrane protein (DUF4010 family)
VADLELWQALGVALAIGLLVGAEREHSKPDGGSAGIRTFALIGLVGAIAVVVPLVVAAALVGATALLIVVGHVQSRSLDPGMTSETAAIVTLGLGALAVSHAALAVGLAVAMTVLLMSRGALHRFVQETVTERERIDALKFFVAAFVVLPLLPDRSLGPYGAWVPQRIWLLVVLIIGIGWVGYAATRLLGARRGLMVTGLAGGFVSGTATTGVMAAKARQGTAPTRGALAGAVLASVATLVQLVVVTSFAEPRVTSQLVPAALVGAVILVCEAWWLGRTLPTSAEPVEAGRPFALLPALLLAAVISSVLPVAIWLQDRYGSAGAIAATGTAALADVHGASVAVAQLVHVGEVPLASAVVAIGVGLAANTVGKVVAAGVAGGVKFAAAFVLCMLPAVVAVGLALVAV